MSIHANFKVVGSGFKAFMSVQGDGTEYRILQPALPLVVPYLTQKRFSLISFGFILTYLGSSK